MKVRLLVCGSHNARDPGPTERALERRREVIDCLIVGGARGVDTFARRWGEKNGFPVLRIDAAWTYYGRAAGPVRNEWMLKFGNPTHVLALPGGSGTANMIEQARNARVPVKRVKVRK